MAFSVITDTAGNLPRRIVDGLGIIALPLTYHIDGEDRVCDDIEAFDGEAFYARLRNGENITTSQVTPDSYITAFEPILRGGRDIICVCTASGISGTFNSASIAANMMMEKYPGRKVGVIDSRGAALGEGFIAMRAARLRDEGTDFDTAIQQLEAYVMRMCNVFTVDDLMFLRRSGRLSNIASFVGTILNVKPLLKGSKEAKIVSFGKVRGRKKSIEALAQKYNALVKHPETQTIGIVSAACNEDAEKLVELIKAGGKAPAEILRVEYDPVTGSHVGPGALALFFEGDDTVRDDLDKA